MCTDFAIRAHALGRSCPAFQATYSGTAPTYLRDPCRDADHDGCCSFPDHPLRLSSSQPSIVLNGYQLFLLPCNCCVCIPKSVLAKFERGGLPIVCLCSFISYAFTVSRFSRGLCSILCPRLDTFNGAPCTYKSFQKDSRMSMKTGGVESYLNMDV